MKRRNPDQLVRATSTTPIAAASLTDAQLLDIANERGYKLACRCIRCGHWMAAEPVSLDHIGPTCRRKLDAADQQRLLKTSLPQVAS
jgi:hypothetical protein